MDDVGPRGGRSQRADAATLTQHFGTADGLLPLWIAEPDLPVADSIRRAIGSRCDTGWYGYETRPTEVIEAFWEWMSSRHEWDGVGVHTSVSPSVGTSMAVLIDQLTGNGAGVIIQPPVFTDFKTIIAAQGRRVVRDSLMLTDDGYRMDFDRLADVAVDPATELMILCSPHNPVGRVWTHEELTTVATICAEHDVTMLADEIHADLTLPPHRFVPFAVAAAGTGVRWAAMHGPIKTFGLAGVCDTLVVTNDDEIAERFGSVSSRFHLTRNNVFALSAFEAAYRDGAQWLDDFLDLIARNVAVLEAELPDEVDLVAPEGTYLAWLDLRRLGLGVTELPGWLASSAGLALSPGHWFGREGAGFARMTIASPTDTIERAADQLRSAARRRAAPRRGC